MKTNKSAIQDVHWHSFVRNFACLTASALFTIILSLPTAIYAQAVETGEVVELEEFAIEGILLGQARALKSEREADSLRSVISADNIGRLPDGNAAESVQRLVGMATEIDQGEGRYVVIRGIDPNLNNVKIDGALIAAPEGDGRRVSLDVVPSDLIAEIEVVKALTPDMDGDAIGGSVNIKTSTAFDTEGWTLRGSFKYGINELDSSYVRTDLGLVGDQSYTSWSPEDASNIGGTFTIGNLFGVNKEWGILVNTSYWNRTYQSNLFSVNNRWVDEDDAGFLLPEDYKLFAYQIFRERIGVNVNLDYRPSKGDSEYFVRFIFNEFTDDEGRAQLDFDYRRGNLVDGSDANTGSFTKGRAKREFRSRKLVSQIRNISLGGENRFGDWTVDYMFTSAFASEETPRRVDWEFRSGSSAFPNSYDLTDFFPSVDAGEAINDPEEFGFRRVRSRTELTEEDIIAVSLNVQRDMKIFGHPGYLKFGFKRLARDKTLDENRVRLNEDDDWDMSLVAVDGPDPFFGGRYTLGPVINVDAAQALIVSNPELFEPDLEDNFESNASADYDIEEDIFAVYGMARVDIGKLRILGGVRVEFTDNRYSANDLQFDVDEDIAGNEFGILVTRITGGKSYDNVLPSIHLRYTATEDVQLRLSYTKSISRPFYEDLAPRQETEREEIDGELFGSISRGNPSLKPFESTNFDLSVDYYMGETNVISAGVFYKELKNPIFNDNGRFTNVTIDGFVYDEVSISQPVNAGEGDILGLELNYQTRFAFLPAPFDGFGISANVTFIDSGVTVTGPTDFGVGPDVVDDPFDVPFFKQSDFLYNVAFWYQKHGIQARLAWNHKGRNLKEIGSNSSDRTEDVITEDRTQVDFKASYSFANRWTVFVEVLNITNKPLQESASLSIQLNEWEFYETTVNFGFRWSL